MTAKRRRKRLPPEALELFKSWGAEGGRAGTGAAKARSSEQARAAVNARWARARAEKAARGG